jgi:hypothetical protein
VLARVSPGNGELLFTGTPERRRTMLRRHENTRSESQRARRSYRNAIAGHGWTHDSLPLRATLAECLEAKATDDECGDRAADALDRLRQ